MKLRFAAATLGMAGLSAVAGSAPDGTPAPVVQEAAARGIEVLIRELADESFRVRERASLEIWELGEAALPALREAVLSADPEQSYRARDLMRKIELHITPGTDATVIRLVERYLKASPTEKPELFGKLRDRRAWRQMLRLYAAETNVDLREKLREPVNGVAIHAARERLIQGDPQGAREFLELAPADEAGLLALAEFHRSHGTLEAEWERARAIGGKKSAAWQLALQRAAGNPELAVEAAGAAGEPRIAAIMAAMAGDPLPWLRDKGAVSEQGPVADAYSAIAIARWEGRKVRTADWEPLTRALASRKSSERANALTAMFLLGESRAGEAAFVKNKPLPAFLYLESLERIPEALVALGLDPERPDYRGWVEGRLRALSVDDVEDQHEASTTSGELVAMANFLERRGLHAEAREAFSGPMADLAKKSADAFDDFLSRLFGDRESLSGAPRLAKHLGEAWAGDDGDRWSDLVVAAFGDDEECGTWWDWLGELNPAASRSERMEGMLALYGMGPDPSRLRDRWLALAWKAVGAAAADEAAVMVERIAKLSFMTGDVAGSLKAWDQLPEDKRREIFWGQAIMALSAVGRWEEAAALILEQLELSKTARREMMVELHAYAAAALRQAGRAEEAAAQDAMADRLCLGDAALAIRIGNGYAYGTDFERAAAWWKRAAFLAETDSSEFLLALKLHSDVLLEKCEWRQAAATSELVTGIYAAYENISPSPLPLMRQRMSGDMARALDRLKTKRPESIAMLRKCHQSLISDGSLADAFFPALRREGLIREHDEWFLESWEIMERVIARYPESDNTRNTAAWLASRAVRKIGEAERHLKVALAANPDQPAYLDTMAEIRFARGDRKGALEWSSKAIHFAPEDPQLRRQHERFRSAPLPR